MPGTPRKPASKPISANKPATPRAGPPEAGRPPMPAGAPNARWQRTVRYNWDKGGSHGGRR